MKHFNTTEFITYISSYGFCEILTQIILTKEPLALHEIIKNKLCVCFAIKLQR